jgi:hypothetical protein
MVLERNGCGGIRMLEGEAGPGRHPIHLCVCYKVVPRVLQGSYKGVTRMLQGCYKGVTGCYKGVTRMLQGCDKGVTRV